MDNEPPWPIVGKTAISIPAHASNIKNEILALVQKSQFRSQAGGSAPIPYVTFKELSISVLEFVDKILDQPNLKELTETIERINEATKAILSDVKVVKENTSRDVIVDGSLRGVGNASSAAKETTLTPSTSAVTPTPKVADSDGASVRLLATQLSLQASEEDGKLATKNLTTPTIARYGQIQPVSKEPLKAPGMRIVLEKRNPVERDVHGKVYTQLDSDTREIRLVTLLSSADSDQGVRCELSTMSLDSKPIYKALSYTWGDPNNTIPIILSGRPFLVTKNLEKALRRLRTMDTDLPVWIDAICINQADNKERTSQVGLMRTIFQSAEEVLVWLGDESALKWNDMWMEDLDWRGDVSDLEKINSILSIAETLEENPDRVGARSANRYILGFCLIRLMAGDVHPIEIPLLRNKFLRTISVSTLALIKKPWWNRIWVVQEVILPPKVTMLFERITAPLSMFTQAAVNFKRHQTSCCSKMNEGWNLSTGAMKFLPDFSDKVMETVKAVSFWERKEGTPLLSLLQLFRSRAATDDRDKIYGLLSLVTDWENGTPIAPDYSLSASELYQKVAIQSIKSTKSLNVLSCNSYLRQQQGELRVALSKFKSQSTSPSLISASILEWNIPSWAPEWKPLSGLSHGINQSEWFDRGLHFNASAGKDPRAIPLGHASSIWMTAPRVLSVMAIHVGTVGEIIDLPHNKVLSYKTSFLSLQYILGRPILSQQYGGENEKNDALWRTLCADTFFNIEKADADESKEVFRRARPDDRKAFQAWKTWVERTGADAEDSRPDRTKLMPQSNASDIAEVNRAVRTAGMGRCLFTTEEGHIGLGQGRMVTDRGDEIWVLLGSRMPFILRPVGHLEVEGAGNRPCHAVICDCYVHGIMDGELVGKGTFLEREIYLI